MKASVVIANYNNAKYIEDCINSLNSQTYNNVEIIFFDDNSKDNSTEIIKKFHNIKLIENDIQTNFGSFNQMNAFKKAIEMSTGDIIFFLDSDDFFHEEKIEKIVNAFLNNDDKLIIYDLPIIVKDDLKIYQKRIDSFFKTYWGYIHPTSCISIRKKFINKVFDSTLNNKFPNIWLDLRILLFSKYLHRYDVIYENLTYYRQSNENVSSKFKKYSKSWWFRRNEAHDYYFDFIKKNNLKFRKNLDYYITKIINKLIK
jgi:glycosyltransferase involved in cell wall biosynthesis